MAARERLFAAAGGGAFAYTYSVRDGWEHEVPLEQAAEAEADVAYPRQLTAKRRRAAKDMGRPWDYAELLEALADTKDEKHGVFVACHGGPLGPGDAEPDRLAPDVATLAGKGAITNSLAREVQRGDHGARADVTDGPIESQGEAARRRPAPSEHEPSEAGMTRLWS
jgi:hypothetical protein